MDKDLLRQVILDQQSFSLPSNYVPRQLSFSIEDYLATDACVILTGVRRCGKSTLLQYIRSIQPQRAYYLNFDDDRLAAFSLETFSLLFELLIELFGEQQIFYFDEIQNIIGWERFVRRLHDTGKKIFITGSNASMLSRELGTRLTGRYVQLEVYPFSFLDFLRLRAVSIDLEPIERLTTPKRALIKREFNAYLDLGGFPEHILSNDSRRLSDLYKGILYRDVMARHKLSNERALKILAHFLASNAGKTISFNSLKSLLSIKSGSTIAEYCAHLQDAFLMFLTNKFEFALKKQINTAKKTYFIDSALAVNVGFRFSEDYGRLLENVVFLELRRRGFKDVFYHEGKHECDFVVQSHMKVMSVIQVTKSIEPHNELREIAGLLEAIEKYSPEEALLLTDDQEKTLKHQSHIIRVLPVWKWLLQKSGYA